MVLERAQDDLHAADHFIGHVHLLIWKSGQTMAFKYAIQEDYLLLSSGTVFWTYAVHQLTYLLLQSGR